MAKKSEEKGARTTKKTNVDIKLPKKFIRHKTFALREDAEDIFYPTVEEKYEAEAGEQASRSFTELATGILPRRVCQAKVTGYREHGEMGPSVIARFVSKDAPGDDPVMVVIPYKEYTEYSLADLANMHFASKKIYLKNQQGRTISFIPTGAKEAGDSTFFYGSRVQALRDMAWDFWFSYIKGSTRYRYREGSIVPARIVDVFDKGIRIDVYGVETVIYLSELSWVWITDARDEFEPGEQVMVKIKRLERSGGHEKTDPYSIRFEASVKEATKDPHIAAADLIMAGDYTRGKIVKNVPNERIGGGHVLVRPDDMKIDVHCPYPKEGDENFAFREGSIVEIKYAAPKFDDNGRVRINAKMKHLHRY